jgi:hypothetical protein
MSDEKSIKPPTDTPKPTDSTPIPPVTKKEPWAPLPPGQAGNPMKYVPIPKDQQKKRGPAPRKGVYADAREKVKAKKKGLRTLPSLDLTRKKHTEIFSTIEQIEQAANDYRDKCQESGDLPTINGFCLSCGCGGSLLAGYIDGPNKDLAQAAQAIADWIIEQMDQTTFRGNCAVAYAQHMGVNQHNRVNSRTYSESTSKREITGEYTLSSIIDKADTGGLPAPPGTVKRLQGSKVAGQQDTQGNTQDRQQVIEMAPVKCTKGQSRPGSKAAARSVGKGKAKS